MDCATRVKLSNGIRRALPTVERFALYVSVLDFKLGLTMFWEVVVKLRIYLVFVFSTSAIFGVSPVAPWDLYFLFPPWHQ